ncbi:unnamed protein product [Paramecium octaurelia]|uniref:Uncharacterized protein n=1 Tax=Paramecium octaurelia TaxID=43137 RepID=A0A8S1TZE3_PAROT|nr:unnamed protein product [Paramecium octaurelia]
MNFISSSPFKYLPIQVLSCLINSKLMDQTLNLNKILKQWDECISNKEILKRIKQKASQKPKNEEIKEKDSIIQIINDQLQRQLSWKSRSSGIQSQFSRQSINQGRPAGSPRQDRMDRMGSRVSMMSPLIHEDMIIKNELKIKFVQIQQLESSCNKYHIFLREILQIIDLKTTNTADKIDLIKSIQDENKLSQKQSINFFNQVDLEQPHQIHYYSCLLNHEDAAYYVNQQQLQNQNTYESEELIYSYLEPFLQFNITLGFKYNLKPKAQEFIKKNQSNHQSLIQSNTFLMLTPLFNRQMYRIKLIFDQENDNDLKAYQKKSLSQFIQLFNDKNYVSTSQVQSFNKLVNPISSQLSNKKVQEDLHTMTPITIMLNSQACKIIENSILIANHIRLLFSLSKVILLYDANNKSLIIIQNLVDEPKFDF